MSADERPLSGLLGRGATYEGELTFEGRVRLDGTFKGKLTTTEFLCRHVFDAIAKAAKDGALGEDGKGLAKIRVTLHETDLARAWFEGPVNA